MKGEKRPEEGEVGEGGGDIAEEPMRIVERPIGDGRPGCGGVGGREGKGGGEKEAEREAGLWSFWLGRRRRERRHCGLVGFFLEGFRRGGFGGGIRLRG